MNYTNNLERERILNQALRARTLIEIATAVREMDYWVDCHPDDLGIVDAYELIENMKEIAEAQETERTGGVLTGKAA